MEKKIKRFQRLATLRKRDISKEITNSNLLENEITKNKNLIDQINTIMDSSKDDPSKKIISSGYFKNNAQLLNTLQSQKNIAANRNKYLLNEKQITQKKILMEMSPQFQIGPVMMKVSPEQDGSAATKCP